MSGIGRVGATVVVVAVGVLWVVVRRSWRTWRSRRPWRTTVRTSRLVLGEGVARRWLSGYLCQSCCRENKGLRLRFFVLVVAVGSFGDGLSEVPTAARSR